jgi:hypothetical protein
MSSTVFIGTSVSSAQRSVWATASFDNISVTGSSAPPPPSPTPCSSVTLDRPSYYAGGPEANWRIAVSAPTSTCTWTATSDAPWLIVKNTTPSPAIGSGFVNAQALTNSTGSLRTGRLTIGGVVFPVTQEALAGTPPPPPPSPGGACSSVALDRTSYYAGGPEANWTITVSAPTSSCTWAATSDSSWLVVKSTTPTPPAGNGIVSVQATSNTTGVFRVGRFTIGGTVYTVSQEQLASAPPPTGGACASVTLDRLSYYAGAPEANWSVGVTAPSSTCTWTAVSDSSWLVVKGTTPAPPAGSGTVGVKAVANTSGAFRFGRLTIGGRVFTVTQEP